MAARGIWDSASLQEATSASLLALNYLNQGINFFTLSKDLFEDRAYIGQWEIDAIGKNGLFWNNNYINERVYANRKTQLNWVGNSTQPIKARERGFGRTINAAYDVFNKILGSDLESPPPFC